MFQETAQCAYPSREEALASARTWEWGHLRFALEVWCKEVWDQIEQEAV